MTGLTLIGRACPCHDRVVWEAAYGQTRELFRLHFGITLDVLGAAGTDCENGQLCVPQSVECDKSAASTMSQVRPRPDRTAVPG